MPVSRARTASISSPCCARAAPPCRSARSVSVSASHRSASDINGDFSEQFRQVDQTFAVCAKRQGRCEAHLERTARAGLSRAEYNKVRERSRSYLSKMNENAYRVASDTRNRIAANPDGQLYAGLAAWRMERLTMRGILKTAKSSTATSRARPQGFLGARAISQTASRSAWRRCLSRSLNRCKFLRLLPRASLGDIKFSRRADADRAGFRRWSPTTRGTGCRPVQIGNAISPRWSLSARMAG